jgi:mannose/fructose/N-acetylgalactosamine-specific phosphotransferase system component IIC
MKQTGIAILVIGFLLTIFTAFNFFTREKVVDLGKIEITRRKPHYLSWSPIVGVAIMGIGAVVLWQSTRKA